MPNLEVVLFWAVVFLGTLALDITVPVAVFLSIVVSIVFLRLNPYNKYTEEFFRRKIVWNRIAKEKLFSLVEEGIFIQDSMHFFTGKHLKYLCAILNSQLFSWLLRLIIGDAVGGNAGNSDNVRNLHVTVPSEELKSEIERLFESKKYKEIDGIIYDLYGLSTEEVDFIKSVC